MLLIDALGPELPQVDPIPVKRKITVKEEAASGGTAESEATAGEPDPFMRC